MVSYVTRYVGNVANMKQAPHKAPAVALVVQSDVLQRLKMAANLRRGGFEVLEAADANEAARVLNNRVVDVLFSDIDLCDDSGIELAGRLRQYQPSTGVVLTHEDRLHPGRPLSH